MIDGVTTGMTGAAAAARVEPINQSRATVAFDPDNGIIHKVANNSPPFFIH